MHSTWNAQRNVQCCINETFNNTTHNNFLCYTNDVVDTGVCCLLQQRQIQQRLFFVTTRIGQRWNSVLIWHLAETVTSCSWVMGHRQMLHEHAPAVVQRQSSPTFIECSSMGYGAVLPKLYRQHHSVNTVRTEWNDCRWILRHSLRIHSYNPLRCSVSANNVDSIRYFQIENLSKERSGIALLSDKL